MKSRSRTASKSPRRAGSGLAGGLGPAVLKAATEAAKSARSAVLLLRRGRDPAPKDKKKEKAPIEERLNLPKFPEEGKEPRISPMRIVPDQADIADERSPSGERRDARTEDEESDQGDRSRRRFRYEEPSSESEINAVDYSQDLDSAEAIWATVDSGAATSCLPGEMCRKMGLSISKTTDLPYPKLPRRPVLVSKKTPSQILVWKPCF